MITEVKFKNYKIFKKSQVLELRPFTILLGKNNTGKSAVLKLLTLIEGSLYGNLTTPISLINNGIECANEFSDLVYGKFSRSLQITLTDNQGNTIEVRVIIDVNANEAIIESWKYNSEIELLINSEGGYTDAITDNIYRCSFDGFLLSYMVEVGMEDSSIDLPDQENFRISTDYIGCFRAQAKKYYDFQKSTPFERSGIDGSNLYNYLISDFLTTEKETYQKVNAWIKNNFGGWELHIDTDSEPYKIELRKDKLTINLFDTGEGISQSLPLIIRAHIKEKYPKLIISEEPEGHLHPYAHAQMAQLIFESHKSDHNKRFLIETHSQNFVLRLRRLVAEGEINPEDLAIYYVDHNEADNESNLMRIEVKDRGEVTWWPEGIFNETSKETRALFNAGQKEK